MITKAGSISPCSMCVSNGRKCWHVWCCLTHFQKVKPLANAAPTGTLSASTIDAWNGHDAAFTARVDGLTQRVEAVSGEEHSHLGPVIEGVDTRAMCFHPHRINTGIRATSSG